MMPHALPVRLLTDFRLYAIAALAVAGSLLAFPPDYLRHSNVWLGALLFPLSLQVVGPRRLNGWLLAVTGLLLMLAVVYHVKIFYFFALALAVVVLVEWTYGRVNTLVLFLIVVMSPFFHQVSTILGFPVRLALSAWAGHLLGALGLEVVVHGNVMVRHGATFAVDDACMGLNMLAITLLMAVAIIVYAYRGHGRVLGLGWLVLYFGAALGLNLVANLLRIMLLVWFEIPPGEVMHDGIGVLVLLAYVMLPLYGLGPWLVRRYGRVRHAPEHAAAPRGFVALSALVILVVLAALVVRPPRVANTAAWAVTFRGVPATATGEERDVLRVFDGQTLVYVKPIAEFFSGEHTPLMCWRGSGYTFRQIEEVRVDDAVVFRGRLSRAGERDLWTAWWYTNGETNTISQYAWRLDMLLRGKPYVLVNVTTDSAASLAAAVQAMLRGEALALRQGAAVAVSGVERGAP